MIENEWHSYDMLVSTISPEILLDYCFGELRWAGRDFIKIVLPIKDIFPILVSMREPGKKCHTVVEGFGLVPIREGRTYLLNPYRKHVVVNTSDTEECVRIRTQAIPGKRFGEFVNCITRTYFELEGRLGKDYLRQLPIKPKKGPKQTVMDY